MDKSSISGCKINGTDVYFKSYCIKVKSEIEDTSK